MQHHQRFRTIFSFLFLATINSGIAQTQVIPDGTLPTVVETLGNMNEITGGKSVGNNLFHSFDKFSIPEGAEAIFKNALNIENIFTRVTGSEISRIEGLLKTSGGANFFLINPNGIVFGENARLDVGGSFIATTADRVEFADGKVFSASDNQEPILTIDVPIGLSFLGNNGGITVNGSGNQITDDSSFRPVEFSERPTGISVNNGQTLALVGNGINFNGGVVTTEGGKINLTSIELGSVNISQTENNLALIDRDIAKYQDINLNQQSLINGSGEKVGSISIIGQNIILNDGSFIFARNQGEVSDSSINIKASESLNLSGIFPSPDGNIASVIRTETVNNIGEGGNINVFASNLSLQNTARIQALTFSDATGGDVKIQASQKINLGTGFINASTRGEGNAGTINLSTSQLKLSTVGIISSTSIGENNGNAGEIVINADSIDISGTTRFSRTNISTSSFTLGDGGNITINTKQLKITDGASISSSSFNNGNAGNVIINASESIEVSGNNENFQGSDNSESTIRTAVQVSRSGFIAGFKLPAIPTGNSGNLTINTPSLKVSQEGFITVENEGTGRAGTLEINADNLNLDKAGRISAAAQSGIGGDVILNTQNLDIFNNSQITTTASGNENGGNITINTTNLNAKKNTEVTASSFEGDGGNIEINGDSIFLSNQDRITAASKLGNGGNVTLNLDRLQLENNSNISALAGGKGNGGNIEITGDNVIVLNNSKITANAFEGTGGNINITANGFFVSPDSSITASSDLGIDGTVNITTLSSDLEKELRQSEPTVAEISEAIAKTCLSNQRSQTSLVVGGTGGLPLNTDSEHQNLDFPLTGFGSKTTNYEFHNIEQNLASFEDESLIPATQMIKTKDGEIYLVGSLQEAREILCSEK